MSRWSPDRALFRLGDAAGAAPVEGVSALDSLLAGFEAELDARALRRGTRLDCVLGGECVRYRIVPWRDDLATPAQRQRLAEQVFVEAYGEVARGWTVRQHAERHGAATLACAIDAALLDRLAALALARGLKLASVQPALMHDHNRSRFELEAGWCWFVSVEAAWTTAVLMTPSEPLHVRRLPSGDGDLARLLDREWFTLGIDAPRCPVYVVRTPGGMAETRAYAWRANSHWSFVPLPGPADSESEALAA